jgi:hypothetical protein
MRQASKHATRTDSLEAHLQIDTTADEDNPEDVVAAGHYTSRRLAAKQIARRIEPASQQAFNLDLRRAFKRNIRWWRSLFRLQPKGWHVLARRRVARIRDKQETMVRRLNDRFTQPSG